jgi:hypothetical protein
VLRCCSYLLPESLIPEKFLFVLSGILVVHAWSAPSIVSVCTVYIPVVIGIFYDGIITALTLFKAFLIPVRHGSEAHMPTLNNSADSVVPGSNETSVVSQNIFLYVLETVLSL